MKSTTRLWKTRNGEPNTQQAQLLSYIDAVWQRALKEDINLSNELNGIDFLKTVWLPMIGISSDSLTRLQDVLSSSGSNGSIASMLHILDQMYHCGVEDGRKLQQMEELESE